MSDSELFAAYTNALREHGGEPVLIETCVLNLTQLAAALQLSLRHPNFPATVRPCIESFLVASIDRMRAIDPVIAHVMAAGNDPSFDEEHDR